MKKVVKNKSLITHLVFSVWVERGHKFMERVGHGRQDENGAIALTIIGEEHESGHLEVLPCPKPY